MTTSASVADITTVDFSAYTDNATLAQAIGVEMERTGVMYLSNTGFNHQLIADLWEPARRFFALPDEVKSEYPSVIPPLPGTGGYIQFGKERSIGDTDDGNEKVLANDREGFTYYPFLDNMKIPDEDVAPGFIPKNQAVADACLDLSWKLMDCLSLWWEKDASHVKSLLFNSILEGHTNNNITDTIINYYGVLDHNAKEGYHRFVGHKDRCLFTLLWPHQVGLQIHQTGDWLDVPLPSPGSMLLFCGTAMETITDNKMQAMLHRVVVPPGAKETERRSSTGYFLHPDNDVPMVPLGGDSTDAETFIENKQRAFSVWYT